MVDRDARQTPAGSSIATQYGLALGLSLALPVVGIAGAAIAGIVISGAQDRFWVSAPWQIYSLSVAIGTLVIGMILGVLWIRMRGRVRRELMLLASVCRSAAAGESPSRLALQGQDEITLLRGGINVLLDQREQSGTVNADALALQNQIEKLLQEVSAVGEGDLSVQAEVTPDTLGVLADSFNYMIEELAKVVGRVQSTTQQVIIATRRILERSNDLNRAAETQYAQINQTSAQVEGLAAFILGAAKNATLSADAAQEALATAREGEDAVVQTIRGMQQIREKVQDTAKKIKRLGERSQEISDIVRIIEELAEQTNLLALNAAIQSAMAGENGRGFAVVADEIRILAERSGEAAKKISVLVKNIQTETQEAVIAMENSTTDVVVGSNMADNAGRALQTISVAVERQAQMVEAIARDANERASASEAVAMAMNRISEITRQASAAMQDTASSVMYLSELADQLRASVSTFKLPHQNRQGPMMGGAPMSPPMIGPARYNGPPTYSGMPALPPGYGPPNGSQSGQWNVYDQSGFAPPAPGASGYGPGASSRPMGPNRGQLPPGGPPGYTGQFPGMPPGPGMGNTGQFPGMPPGPGMGNTGQFPPAGLPHGSPFPPPPAYGRSSFPSSGPVSPPGWNGPGASRPYPGETAQRLPGSIPSEALGEGPGPTRRESPDEA